MGNTREGRPRPEVRKKLDQLKARVPGRVTTPGADAKRTLIAGQLMKVAEEEVVIQVGHDTYAVPIAAIEDIRDLENPRDLERMTGVDVVMVVENSATLEARVGDLARKSELPFPLVNAQPGRPLSDSDRELLRTRTERWMKLNGLVFEMEQQQQGEYGTLLCMCSAMTLQGAGNMTCDSWDQIPEVTFSGPTGEA